MKKTYQQPSLQVVKIQHTQLLCTSDPVQSVSGNSGLTGAGANGEIIGGSGPSRVRGRSVWDEEY
ncbi:MAG: hypothetical protein K5945_09085 [Bacteroidaceae bacterium]|nr:hypothetical protein [Bacteroidaceae bacterium]